MKATVTGGTGYFGGLLVERLLKEGAEVTALVRDPSRAPASWKGRVTLAQGDITKPETLEPAFKDAEVLFHAAAHVKRWDPDPSSFHKINVQGFQNVLLTARELRIPRIIYTSSFIALGPSGSKPLSEDEAKLDRPYHNEYERTKTEALKLARAAAGKGVPIISIFPGVIYGPGAMTEGNLIGGYFLRSILPVISPGTLPWSYVWNEDVVEGHILAWKQGKAPGEYILGGENVSILQVIDLAGEILGKRPRSMKIPYSMAKLIARLQMLKSAIRGTDPDITPGEVEIFQHPWAYDSGRAIRELGYKITPLREGLAKTLEWIATLKR